MNWLTMDQNKIVTLWRLEPAYFGETNEWGHPRAFVANDATWPAITGIAEALRLKPGPTGKAEIVVEFGGIALQ